MRISENMVFSKENSQNSTVIGWALALFNFVMNLSEQQLSITLKSVRCVCPGRGSLGGLGGPGGGVGGPGGSGVGGPRDVRRESEGGRGESDGGPEGCRRGSGG